MAGADNEVFNTRERPVSNDHNDLQSMAARTLADMLREMFVKRSFSLGLAATEAPRNVILGGLEVTPSGSDLLVAPGALMQESATLTPAPGALDSNYRIAILRSAATVIPPSPAGDTWFLLEAQMTEVTTVSESRDILDVPTATFLPASVPKQRERRLLFSFVTGTATEAPVPTGGNFVPIAMVFRPAGGGAVLATHLIDTRTMWDAEAPLRDTLALGSLLQRDRGQRFLLTSSVPGTPSNSMLIDAEAFVAPTRLWYTRSGSLNVTAAFTLSPGTVLSADTWYYLYLASWQGIPIVSVLDPFSTGRGILVLSAVVPITSLLKNSLAVPLPAPFGITDLPGGVGVCVAALRRNAANTGWLTAWSVGNNEMRIVPVQVTTATPATAARTTVALGAFIPKTAKTVRVRVSDPGGFSVTAPNTTPAPVLLSWLPVAGGTTFTDDYAHTELDRKGGIQWVVDLPVVAAQSFDFIWSWSVPPLTNPDPLLRFEIIGWSE
ncbi:hypothetical protein LCGC14_0414870 [marine sediment metagenome]|uniref:Uncharacterized protein n=1 Tax=marine sediment metagenome TaxID=412755 RepID=A0A0F9TAT0_9ZZZZ